MDETSSANGACKDGKQLAGIIAKVQGGDTAAFAYIIVQYQKPIYLYCYYLLRNRQEAEDAAQDIFIRGLANIGQYVPSVSFSAWLYRIAHNHCNDLLKKQSRAYKGLLSYRRNQAEGHTPEYTDYIMELLNHLRLEEKQILLLRALEEYSYEEIAEIMNIKAATVRKKYERIRKKCIQQKELGNYAVYATKGR